MLGHRDQVALHQAAGGLLGVGQRFLDRGAIVGVHRRQHRLLLVPVEILDDRDRIVGVELPREVGDLARIHLIDQCLADMLVEFGIDVGIDDPGERGDQAFALVTGGKFDQVGDVGGMKRLDQGAGGVVIASLDRVEHLGDEIGAQPVLGIHHRAKIARRRQIVVKQGGGGFALSHPGSLTPRAALLWPRRLWRNPSDMLKAPPEPLMEMTPWPTPIP